ncbi:MAG: hypothetical protein JNL67_10125 [Planctomycetaceae bacterium]|nr:hypothetical protein [Planctomycetaceae bacterium]
MIKKGSVATWIAFGLLLWMPSRSWTQESNSNLPKAIPQGRAAVLEALEKLKHREARLPLTEQEPDPAQPPGALGVVNNGRMRKLYLPAEFQASGTRTPDPAMTLPNDFGVELFWIASRVNNCHYCLGHQEVKLKKEGLTEEMLLWLDTDWKRFSPRHQAGFEFARVLTEAPHTITDELVTGLKKHFTELEILEMAFLVGRYNSTNRWTDSLGIPQEMERDFSTSLSAAELEKPSTVVGRPPTKRPLPSDLEAWRKTLAEAKLRKSRLPLATTAENVGEATEPHAALLLNFPIAGKQWLDQWSIAKSTSHLPKHLSSCLLFVCAVEDGAPYVQHLACEQLVAEGWSEPEVFALLAEKPDSERGTALQFARKLTHSPQSMTDQDIVALQRYFSPSQIAEIIYRVGLAAQLDRVTEVAGLGWD